MLTVRAKLVTVATALAVVTMCAVVLHTSDNDSTSTVTALAGDWNGYVNGACYPLLGQRWGGCFPFTNTKCVRADWSIRGTCQCPEGFAMPVTEVAPDAKVGVCAPKATP